MNKLGVLGYGDDTGYPFDKLFNGIIHVDKPKDMTKDIRALVFWGGTDIWSGFYGEKPNKFNQNRTDRPSVRDSVEWSLMDMAIKEGIPIIGVCRGAQMMCAKAGGKLVQHVTNHHGSHILHTDEDRAIYSNSCHHQMMLLPNEGADIIAWTKGLSNTFIGENDEEIKAPEKEPEIVYFNKMKGIGIQGHPEWMERDSSFVNFCLSVIKEKIL